jgi:hypothetical protein
LLEILIGQKLELVEQKIRNNGEPASRQRRDRPSSNKSGCYKASTIMASAKQVEGHGARVRPTSSDALAKLTAAPGSH